MKQEDIYAELSSIRNLMERSAKFISLSGVSGILSGCYALIGAATAYVWIYGFNSKFEYRDHYANDTELINKLIVLAIAVLTLSLGTGIVLSIRKAQRYGQTIWNPASRSLLGMVFTPLLTGGALVFILLFRGYYSIIAPSFLVFYGLALVAGSPYTYKEIRWLGYCEILLGLAAALFPGYGIFFWAFGFGVLHIFYGSLMYFKYER